MDPYIWVACLLAMPRTSHFRDGNVYDYFHPVQLYIFNLSVVGLEAQGMRIFQWLTRVIQLGPIFWG